MMVSKWMSRKAISAKLALAMALPIFGFLAPGVLALSQVPSAGQPKKQESVQYLYPEQVAIPAGKPTLVALHFRVAEGLHINSHTPHERFLIPTSFTLSDNSSSHDIGVRLKAAKYPVGSDLTLPADPSNKLSVYTGEFTIEAHLVAEAGDHLVEGKLRYQACNLNSCMPPRTIPVALDVIAK